jgi:superfamily II DNA/RNA helicase
MAGGVGHYHCRGVVGIGAAQRPVIKLAAAQRPMTTISGSVRLLAAHAPLTVYHGRPFPFGPPMPFAALGLAPSLLQAIADKGYGAPTPIQAAAIPAILRGGDVLAAAQTGSGKTAAFALPILQLLRSPAPPRLPQALILTPTRELATQVGEVMRAFARSMPGPIKIAVVFGGVSINPQMLALRGGADIIVATPGRLLDLLNHNALHLSALRTLVLDEADRLLDLGFADELNRILSLLPAQRQNLLFSATFPSAVQTLVDNLLHQPTRIVEHETSSQPAIMQRAIVVDGPRRTPLLRHLLQTEAWTRVLVFAATKYSTEHVADKLRRNNITATALHGELSQGARSQALAEFKTGRLQVLVATDLAARGIDIEQLPVVVNYDLPRSADDYLHRIGRTGRAGATGIAVSFIDAASEAHFRLIEKRQQLRLLREQIEGFIPQATPTPVVDTAGGIKGKRKSKKDKLREAAAKAQPGNELTSKPAGFVWPALDTKPKA